MASKPIVKVIGTGGTIASVTSSRLDLTLYPETGHRILIKESLDRVPEVNELAEIRSEDLMSEASTFIGPSQWPRIARHINKVFREEPEVDGIVLTHGTGTMEETAYFLQLTVKSSKPVVMTGAMRPASALGTDADLNLYNAIRVAAHPDASGRGVLVVLNNQIHSGRDVTKTDPLHVETFKDYDMGLLGYADPDGEVVFYRSTVRKHTTATPFDVEQIESLPRVDIVSSYAGSDALLVEAVRRNGSAGLVLAGVGGGSVESPGPKAAMEAMKEGMTVALASRTANGRVVMTPGKERDGFIVADNLLPHKARILLMLALTVTKDRRAIQKMFYEY
ncbi:MAG: asparaginase [Chloroflexi bacterium]|nr:asparaginase [Chloroflexota bacterium]